MSISTQETSADRLEQVLANRREGAKFTLAQRFAGLFELPVETLMGMIGLFGCALFNLSDLSTTGTDKVSFDVQVLVKLGMLAMLGLYGGIGVLSDLKVRRTLFSFPVLWMVIILGCYLLSVPGSITPKESLASAVSIACVLFGTTRALVQVGVHKILRLIFFAGAGFLAMSWVLFLFVPSIGVFQEPVPGGQFVARMSGMSHPNTLGQYAGITLLIGFLLWKVYGESSKWRVLILLMAFGALLGSVSRSSLVATVIALAIAYRAHFMDEKYLVYFLWLGAIACVGLMLLSMATDLGALIESKLSSISKSGDSEELTTATGRAEIWGYTLKLIAKEPLTGYGAATSKWFLSDYSLYTHNLFLNVAFSTGVFGGLACLFMLAGRIVSFFRTEHAVADALFAFIIINGLFENVIFSILCGMPTIVWILALVASRLDPKDERNRDLDGLSLGVSQ